MSPIFVRPVREQLEHDRLIRHLQVKYKRKFDVAANVGDEQVAPVKIGANTFFPDLVLMSDRKLAGLVEVESGESVNNLEAMAQWVHFSRARVPFHLYVPVHVYDSARRLCDANQVRVTEIWTYRAAADGFDLVRLHADASVSGSASRASTATVAVRSASDAKGFANGAKPPSAQAAKASAPPAKAPSAQAAKASAPPAKAPSAQPAKASAAPSKASKPKAAKRPAPTKGRKKPPARPARPARPAGRSKRR